MRIMICFWAICMHTINTTRGMKMRNDIDYNPPIIDPDLQKKIDKFLDRVERLNNTEEMKEEIRAVAKKLGIRYQGDPPDSP